GYQLAGPRSGSGSAVPSPSLGRRSVRVIGEAKEGNHMPAKWHAGLALRRERRRQRGRMVGLVAGLALVMAAALPGSGGYAATTGPKFAPAVVLPGGQGGEPSLAIDTSPTSGRNYVYVAAI